MQLEQEIIEKVECLKSWMCNNMTVEALDVKVDEDLNEDLDD